MKNNRTGDSLVTIEELDKLDYWHIVKLESYESLFVPLPDGITKWRQHRFETGERKFIPEIQDYLDNIPEWYYSHYDKYYYYFYFEDPKVAVMFKLTHSDKLHLPCL